MAFCKKCGAQLKDGAKFCTTCGNPINDRVELNIEAKIPSKKKKRRLSPYVNLFHEFYDKKAWNVQIVSLGNHKKEVIELLMKMYGTSFEKAQKTLETNMDAIAFNVIYKDATALANVLNDLGVITKIYVDIDAIKKAAITECSDTDIYEDESEKKPGCMKRIFNILLFSAILLFIMFLPEMCDSCSSKDSEKEQEKTEQVEDKAEKKEVAKPQKVETKKETKKEVKMETALTAKEQEIANDGAQKGRLIGLAMGSDEGFSNTMDVAEKTGREDILDKLYEKNAARNYDNYYGVPTNAEEKRLKQIFVEYYLKAMEAAQEEAEFFSR